MFEDTYPSADNQVSGIVAMLAAAEAIGKVKETLELADKDIMFTFFQGVGWNFLIFCKSIFSNICNRFLIQLLKQSYTGFSVVHKNVHFDPSWHPMTPPPSKKKKKKKKVLTGDIDVLKNSQIELFLDVKYCPPNAK